MCKIIRRVIGFQMETGTNTPTPHMVSVEVLFFTEQDRELANQLEGVQVSTRKVGKDGSKVLTTVSFTREGLERQAARALMARQAGLRANLVSFPSWKSGRTDGQVWLWCEAKVEALQAMMASCHGAGIHALPTIVRTAKREGTEYWLVNASAQWGPEAEPFEAMELLRREGMQISASWEQHVLQVSGVSSHELYHRALECVPDHWDKVQHTAEQCIKLEDLALEAQERGQPGLPLQPIPPLPAEEGLAAQGCIMTPVLYKDRMVWVVPVVPGRQLGALARWLAIKRANSVDMEWCDMRTHTDKLHESKYYRSQSKQAWNQLSQRIRDGKWAPAGLAPEQTPQKQNTTPCKHCCGAHSKHICPLGQTTTLLKAAGEQQEVSACGLLALTQQQAWIKQTAQRQGKEKHKHGRDAYARVVVQWQKQMAGNLPAGAQEADQPWQTPRRRHKDKNTEASRGHIDTPRPRPGKPPANVSRAASSSAGERPTALNLTQPAATHEDLCEGHAEACPAIQPERMAAAPKGPTVAAIQVACARAGAPASRETASEPDFESAATPGRTEVNQHGTRKRARERGSTPPAAQAPKQKPCGQ